MDTGRSDRLYFNAKILTLGKRRRTARALVTEDGIIVATGDDSEMRRAAPRGSKKIDLGGRVVVPGFIDCHTHFIQMGLDSMGIDLSRTTTLDEALTMIRAAARKAKSGEWVVASSWKESGWRNGRFLTRQDLDSCCPDNPAVAHRVCGHLSTVNSKALRLLEIPSNASNVDFESGILKENAVEIPHAATAPDKARRGRALIAAVRMAQALGVTSINDNGASMDFDAYQTAERKGILGIRVWFNTPSSELESRIRLGISTGFGNDWLRIGGVKFFFDGALGARTAALSEPYADDPGNSGMLVQEGSELDDLVSRANEAGIQVASHAIGDVGIGAALTAIDHALDAYPNKHARHRIEHLELPSRSHLEDMRKRGIIASMQPNFIGEWGGTDGMYTARLGKGRVGSNNPFRLVLKAKVRLVFGSDCMPFSPMYGIHSAVNAPHQSQRLTVEEALAAYTKDAAYASFDEHVKGILEEGRFADFAVLSGDPFADPAKIRSIEVLKTVVAGEVVFERSRRKRIEGGT